MRRGAVVIAEQNVERVGIRANHRNPLEVALQRQKVAIIFQQHYGLTRRFQR